MAIAGIEHVVAPELPGATTWAELVYVRADGASMSVHRETLDPLAGYTILAAARKFSYDPVRAAAFTRDYNTGRLLPVYYTDRLTVGMQVVLLEGRLTGGVKRLEGLLNGLAGIMPMRMAWPIRAPHRPRPLPPPPGSVPLPGGPVYVRGSGVL